MTVQTVPYALQNASHSAALFRQSAATPWATGGLIQQGELNVTQQGAPNMSVILGPGRAKVAGTQVSPPAGQAFTTQGMYDVLNDANLTLTVTAANATNPRIDAVYVAVNDAFYSGALNTAVAGIVAGTPAPSPVQPAIPNNAVLIATIAVAANATSIVNANIAVQGVLAALVNVPYAMAAGSSAISASGVTTVTFPAGRFSVAPIVTGQGMVSGQVSFAYESTLPTLTNFGIRLYNTAGTQQAGTYQWVAVQMTPTAAAG